jgi:hypothetical protein
VTTLFLAKQTVISLQCRQVVEMPVLYKAAKGADNAIAAMYKGTYPVFSAKDMHTSALPDSTSYTQ